jgi:hypothetical protein
MLNQGSLFYQEYAQQQGNNYHGSARLFPPVFFCYEIPDYQGKNRRRDKQIDIEHLLPHIRLQKKGADLL